MAISANGSRICDTNLNSLAGIDVNFTLVNTTNIVIFAGGVIGQNGDELKGGDDHTWQFRILGGTFATISLVSEVKMGNAVANTHGNLVANADRRANSGGTFVTVGREFETLNPTTQGQTLKDVRVGESQISLDFSAAQSGSTYEFQCIWTEKNLGPVPIVYTARIVTPVLETLLDAAIVCTGDILTADLQVGNAPVVIPVTNTSTKTNTQIVSKGASRVWWNTYKLRWDAVLPQLIAGSSDEYIATDISGIPVFTSVEVDARNPAIPDTFWDGPAKKLYVFRSHSGNSRISVFNYNDLTDTYTVDGVIDSITVQGIAHANSTHPAQFHITPNGNIWVIVCDNAGVKLQRSSDGGLTWLTSPHLVSATATLGGADLYHYVNGANTRVILVGAEDDGVLNASQVVFTIDQGADPTLSGSYTQETLPVFQGTEESTGSITVVKDVSHNNYVALETGAASSAGNAGLLLYKRTPTGTWSRTVIALKSDAKSRPILCIDDTNSEIYIFYVDSGGGNVYYKKAPLSTLVFGAEVTLFDTTDVFDDVSACNANVTEATDLLVLAHNETASNVWKILLPIDPVVTATLLDASVSCSGAITPNLTAGALLFDSNIGATANLSVNLQTEIVLGSAVVSVVANMVPEVQTSLVLDSQVEVSTVLSGVLSTGITFNSGISGSSSLSSDILTEVLLLSDFSLSGNLVSGLVTEINFVSSISAAGDVSSVLDTLIALSGAVQSSVVMATDLSVGVNIFLDSLVLNEAVIQGNLLTQIPLSSSLVASGNVLSGLLTQIPLSSSLVASGNVLSGLLTQINFESTASSSSDMTSDLSVGVNIFLEASPDLRASVQSDIITSINLESNLQSSGNLVSVLNTSILLGSGLVASSNVTSDLSTVLALASDILGSSSVFVTLSVGSKFDSSVSIQSDLSSDLTTEIPLSSLVGSSLSLTADFQTRIELLSALSGSTSVLAGSLIAATDFQGRIIASGAVSSGLFTSLQLNSNILSSGSVTVSLSAITRFDSVIVAENFMVGDIVLVVPSVGTFSLSNVLLTNSGMSKVRITFSSLSGIKFT